MTGACKVQLLRPRWRGRQVAVALMASEILMTMAATSGVDVVRVDDGGCHAWVC